VRYSDLAVNGLFYAIGHEPATSLIRGQVDTDSDGYIITVPGTTLRMSRVYLPLVMFRISDTGRQLLVLGVVRSPP
jgi:hypothetical protein